MEQYGVIFHNTDKCNYCYINSAATSGVSRIPVTKVEIITNFSNKDCIKSNSYISFKALQNKIKM